MIWKRLLVPCFTAMCLAAGAADSAVRKNDAGKWELTVDGSPFAVHGVNRMGYPETAKEIGVNTIRTYSSASDKAKQEVAAAEKHGFKVIAGLWVTHDGENTSFYNDPESMAAQRESIRSQVRALKDSPGLIIWGLGNEAEHPKAGGVNEAYWRELGELAKIVKEEDPRHPVMNVIAGNAPWKLEALKQYAPAIDIVGINAYAGAVATEERLKAAGWEKPYILTEFGPRGPWESPKTEWQAPVEPSAEEKAAHYLKSFHSVTDGSRQCLGTAAFVWGNKQEATATWFGMFLESGEKTPAVDAMGLAYTGSYPENRCPRIVKLTCEAGRKKVAPGTEFRAKAIVDDPESDPLICEWKVIAESADRKAGGAAEKVPPTIDGCFPAGANSAEATVKAPAKPGAYRLFLFVRDGKGGAATQNIPFLVE